MTERRTSSTSARASRPVGTVEITEYSVLNWGLVLFSMVVALSSGFRCKRAGSFDRFFKKNNEMKEREMKNPCKKMNAD